MAQEGIKTQRGELRVIWSNSSVRTAIEDAKKKTQKNLKNAPVRSAGDILNGAIESTERVNAVLTGVKCFATGAEPVSASSKEKGDTKNDLIFDFAFKN